MTNKHQLNKRIYRCPNGHSNWKYRTTLNAYHCQTCGWRGDTLIDIRKHPELSTSPAYIDWYNTVELWLEQHRQSSFVYADLPRKLQNWGYFQRSFRQDYIKSTKRTIDNQHIWTLTL